jgi:hypothetical protein
MGGSGYGSMGDNYADNYGGGKMGGGFGGGFQNMGMNRLESCPSFNFCRLLHSSTFSVYSQEFSSLQDVNLPESV